MTRTDELLAMAAERLKEAGRVLLTDGVVGKYGASLRREALLCRELADARRALEPFAKYQLHGGNSQFDQHILAARAILSPPRDEVKT